MVGAGAGLFIGLWIKWFAAKAMRAARGKTDPDVWSEAVAGSLAAALENKTPYQKAKALTAAWRACGLSTTEPIYPETTGREW
jgi:hypothetical protein